MGNIQPKALTRLGINDNIARSIAMATIAKYCKHDDQEQIISTLENIIRHPEEYKENKVWGKLASVLAPSVSSPTSYYLRESSLPFSIYGTDGIDELSKRQMEVAMQLPIAIAGALMPDGCAGYGLPIGGVLATDSHVVIPYAVGKDIACRMSLTILDAEPDYLEKHYDRAVKALNNHTAFGLDGILPYRTYHPLFDRCEWRYIPILIKMREKAIRQLGSSGRGNHFVDICEVVLPPVNAMGMNEGRYLGILSHSGSRGLGAAIADYFTAIAKETCRLPRHAGPFAWLSLDSESGQQYWKCMGIAGAYSAANHDCIHQNVARALRLKPLANISNHHNFAWRETLGDGTTAIVHRKGATPAHAGELGIIPGSMATPGFIVSGIGCRASLFSASHGAGRTMSRHDAHNSISRHALRKYLAEYGVTLIGGTTEEAPMAYKDIRAVMEAQKELVNIEGTIIPKIVRMSEE